MIGFGPAELVIVLLIGLVFLAVPVVTLVVLFLIYKKVDRLEQQLGVGSKQE